MGRVHPVLTTLGGARTVTGSKFLVEVGERAVLVDCGLFQGLRELRERNWEAPPVDPGALDSVVITHAHLDHCGYLPRLHCAGFSGTVHATYDTGRLMSVVLPDSARLLEEEATYANKLGYSRHRPALPLYTEEDAWNALDLVTPAPFGTSTPVGEGVEASFQIAGHILGSSSVRLKLGNEVSLVVSGDLGRGTHPLLRSPEPVGDADWIVIESTYGDRAHDADDPVERLADVRPGRLQDVGGRGEIRGAARDRVRLGDAQLGEARRLLRAAERAEERSGEGLRTRLVRP
jgi:metallo-beta-lactamase family protein